jgi:hypothetical protein
MAPRDGGVALWVVHLDGGGDHAAAMGALDALALSPGLWLVRSDLTQSHLYHLVKRETGAESLFVGRLAGRREFMGMPAGALSALRSWDDLSVAGAGDAEPAARRRPAGS